MAEEKIARTRKQLQRARGLCQTHADSEMALNCRVPPFLLRWFAAAVLPHGTGYASFLLMHPATPIALSASSLAIPIGLPTASGHSVIGSAEWQRAVHRE